MMKISIYLQQNDISYLQRMTYFTYKEYTYIKVEWN